MAAARADYGFDAPYVPVGFAAGAVVSTGLTVAGVAPGPEWWVVWAVLFALQAASYVWTTRRGKLAVWDELLADFAWRGDEQVLDVGCGRGAVLIAAARHVARGRATGLDLWSTTDQSGNAEATTRRNAELEGVSERVELRTGDMRKFPFDDASFDVVTSSLAIHNVPDAAGRDAAIDEIVRVLRPGGCALVVDFGTRRSTRRGCASAGSRSRGGVWAGGCGSAVRRRGACWSSR